MNAWIAFTKKEIMAQTRSVKPWLLAGIFVLLSLMNIAIAKLKRYELSEEYDYVPSKANKGGVNVSRF